MFRCEEMVKEAFANIRKDEKSEFQPDGKIIKQSDTLEEYSEKVNKIKQYIIDGHVFQTVLSQRWTIETKQKGFDLYKELREINPSPYMYYFNFEEFEIIGSSRGNDCKAKRQQSTDLSDCRNKTSWKR